MFMLLKTFKVIGPKRLHQVAVKATHVSPLPIPPAVHRDLRMDLQFLPSSKNW